VYEEITQAALRTDYTRLSQLTGKRGELNVSNFHRLDVSYLWETNVIEGSALSREEAELVFSDRPCSTYSKQDVRAFRGTREALYFARQNLDRPLNQQLIRQLHQRIYGWVNGEEAGVYRTEAVRVGSFIPPSADEIPRLMKDLDSWFISDEFESLDPVEAAALAHFQFVYIHPFVDGNGRTARALQNFILERAGFPGVVIHASRRFEYYHLLEQSRPSKCGDTWPLIRLIIEGVEESINLVNNDGE